MSSAIKPSWNRLLPIKTAGLLLQGILNVSLPPRCITCGSVVEEQGSFCAECWKKLEFISEPFCHFCGIPFEYDMGKEAACQECSNLPPPFSAARSAVAYDEISSQLVSGLKFSDKTHLAKPMAKMAARAGTAFLTSADIIAPVPLHYFRLIRRKYNQSSLLAAEISRLSGLPYEPCLLKRRINTKPQTGLPRAERKQNITGAFSVNRRKIPLIKGKHIVLIDDVMTTGATITECARALLESGASGVYALTFARTGLGPQLTIESTPREHIFP